MNFENILNKARENPEADLNVQGRILLELEENNEQCKEKIEHQAKELHITSVKLAKTEKHILRLADLLSRADNNLDQTSKEKETLDKIRHTDAAPVQTLISLIPRQAEATELIPIGQREAATHLIQQCRSLPDLGGSAVPTLVDLVKRSETFRLSPADLNEAAGLLADRRP